MDTPTPTPQPNPFSVPEEIGGYQIQRVLGAGGMATVYAALQKQPRRTVALKVMKAGVAGDNTLRRFKREVEILGKLRHPYIAQVYAAGTHEDVSGATIPYFVMEYVPGAKTLLEFVSMHNLDIRERLKLFVKICAAVEHGHRAKIIHRDLKPGNILIDESGEPKIIDFGVSHTTDMDITAAAGGQTMITEAGRLVGTLHYMSPEQVDTTRQDLDSRCDVYALGVILYKLTTGRFPVDVEAVPLYEAVRLIREKLPTRPSEVNPAVKGDLETIILKSLEKDRLRRYRNAGSLGRDIVRYLAGKPIHGRRAGLLYRSALFVRRHRAASIAAIVVLLTIAAACGFVLWNRMQMLRDAQRILAAGEAERRRQGSATAPTTEPAQRSEAADTRREFTLSGHSGRITALMFSADGKLLASASEDATVLIWDLSSRTPMRTISDKAGAASFMAFSRDSNRLVTAWSERAILITDIANAMTRRMPYPACQVMLSLAVNGTGDRLAVGCGDMVLRVESLTPAGQPVALRGTTGSFTSCAFSPDGTLLAAGSQRGVVYLWKLRTISGTPELQTQFHELNDRIAAVIFSPSADRLIAVAGGGGATVWQLESDHARATEGTAKSFVAATGGGVMVDVSVDPTGQRLACLSQSTLFLWDISSTPPHRLGEPVGLTGLFTAAAIDPAGRFSALGTISGEIHVQPIRSTQ